jgi:hypothetical protein
MQKGDPVIVKFFGENAVKGTVEDADKTKAIIAFGQGDWSVRTPRTWIRQEEDGWVLQLG